MINERWNEICFLLSENLRSDISESDFEQNVIQALRVLDWKVYTGEVEIRPSFQIGATNRITPDFVIKNSTSNKLFVIEIKHPNIPINTKYQQQLFSYMRQLKLEYGILIGQVIQIFYDGDLIKQDDPILLETISFTKDNQKGLRFVEMFSKENFYQEQLKTNTKNLLKIINRKQDFLKLTSLILSENYEKNIKELIKQDFSNEYDSELVDSVLKELIIVVKTKQKEVFEKTEPKEMLIPKNSNNYSDILPIILNPVSEKDFKTRLLVTKKAHITIYYKNGSVTQKVWNVNRFSESSGVLGNLRSRLEFRNGNWQELGIEKVYVSVD
ncbi:type I restriction enzyme HsdR N-terminal domain-containing protein [Polaribacter sp.]|uniref:type I restriction enzyme HsdR N-terminal domain-containing protein n=1 Tax=Polaribacter sp. TaxID=1920175 RepID=UPI0040483280